MGLFKPKRSLDGTIAGHVDDAMRVIKELFPGDTKLTLVVRSDRFKEPLIFTNDAPDAAIEAIRTMTTAKPTLHLAN
jgi:hypothetical protein